jgi:biopolymer transport protein ExbB/TolQ
MGSSEMSVLNTTGKVLQATIYFVLTIWLIVIGSAYYLMIRKKRARRLRSRRKVQVPKLEYDVDLLRRMTS